MLPNSSELAYMVRRVTEFISQAKHFCCSLTDQLDAAAAHKAAHKAYCGAGTAQDVVLSDLFL
jgi:hypothetical protein